MRLTSSHRRSTVDLAPSAAWSVVASGEDRPQWYVDSAPLVFRAGIDRLAGGTGADAPPPGRALLRVGDDAGFWTVTAAAPADARSAGSPPVAGRLELVARVRAPGRVTLAVDVTPGARPGTTELRTTVHLAPRGLVGAAYLLVDLPARETVTELVHRRLVRDVRARG